MAGNKKPDRSAQRVFEYFDNLRPMTATDAISDLTFLVLREFGFEHATCASVPRPGASPVPGILLNNRPEDYIKNYAEKKHAEHDPAVTHLRQTLRPFSWSDVRSLRSMTKRELLILSEARDFRANDGLTIPIVTSPGAITVFCPCGEAPEMTERSRSAVEMIACAAHQALLRAAMRTDAKPPTQAALSPREREVLMWVAAGKTDPEIAAILSVRPKTVEYFVKRACAKLNVYKRQAAVFEAIRQGQINI